MVSPSTSERPPDSAPGVAGGDPREPFQDLARRLAELLEYGSYYLHARLDLARAGVFNAALALATVLLTGLAGAAFITTAVVYVLYGCVLGLSVLFGNRLWLAFLVVGVTALVLLAICVASIFALMRSRRLRAGEQMYDERRRAQRARFGRDIQQAADGNGVSPEPGGNGTTGVPAGAGRDESRG